MNNKLYEKMREKKWQKYLPSCSPRFEPQHNIYVFLIFNELRCEKDENEQKETGIGPY